MPPRTTLRMRTAALAAQPVVEPRGAPRAVRRPADKA